jgi:protoporphyrinogen oxidase
MTKGPILIVGAGPAGLTAGYELSKKRKNVVILEADPQYIGGIARTIFYKEYRFDIGGHRFFSKNKEVERWWADILKKDFLKRPRLSRWYYRGKFFCYPPKPLEILKIFGFLESTKIIISYLKYKLFPIKPEESLGDWCVNNFGYYLAKPFFIDYNTKLWGISPKKISKDFASQRVKGISMINTLKNAIQKTINPKNRKVIKSLIDEFNYPKYGPGQLWEKVSQEIKNNNGKIFLGHKVVKINHAKGKIISVEAQNENKRVVIKTEQVLSTMPLKELILSLSPKPPEEVLEAARNLKFRDFITVALMIDKKEISPDNWIYTHDEGIKAIRVQLFKNWSPFMVPDENKSCIGFEYVCKEGDSLWKLSDKELIELAKKELNELNFAKSSEVFDAKVVRLKNVYPIYLIDYKKNVKIIKDYLRKNFIDNSLNPLGRGGLHRYNNMDHSMVTSFLTVENILKNKHNDPWGVNEDAEYHEETKKED